jgi:hypothetical protein
VTLFPSVLVGVFSSAKDVKENIIKNNTIKYLFRIRSPPVVYITPPL